ncbi:MAG TPA: phosphoribosylaminoimidazolesuccinocarboxamide synthase, partial [Gaiellaceae bacterium]
MSLDATHVASGKVRELYALDDGTLALTASDRISTFDVVLPTPIPDKGKVLTGLSAFWFGRTRALVPNHLLRLGEDGRTMVCRRLEMLPIECVVRGYLAGSGWKDYHDTGVVCGHVLPEGLEESARLPEPIF